MPTPITKPFEGLANYQPKEIEPTPRGTLAAAGEIDFDEYEALAVESVQHGGVFEVDLPLVHKFPPGMYVREIFMPSGTIVFSRTHRFEHPYFILKGRCWMRREGHPELTELKAGDHGITAPGTRRILYIEEDVVWVTVHHNPENLTDPDQIVEEISTHDNPLLSAKGLPEPEAWRERARPRIPIFRNMFGRWPSPKHTQVGP